MAAVAAAAVAAVTKLVFAHIEARFRRASIFFVPLCCFNSLLLEQQKRAIEICDDKEKKAELKHTLQRYQAGAKSGQSGRSGTGYPQSATQNTNGRS